MSAIIWACLIACASICILTWRDTYRQKKVALVKEEFKKHIKKKLAIYVKSIKVSSSQEIDVIMYSYNQDRDVEEVADLMRESIDHMIENELCQTVLVTRTGPRVTYNTENVHKWLERWTRVK